jgi:hypothetical protein
MYGIPVILSFSSKTDTRYLKLNYFKAGDCEINQRGSSDSSTGSIEQDRTVRIFYKKTVTSSLNSIDESGGKKRVEKKVLQSQPRPFFIGFIVRYSMTT